jgi:ribosome-associated translation inhibitor RaiA
MAKFENVRVSNFPEVDEIDRALIEKNFQRFFEKLGPYGGERELHLNVKEYDKGGLKKQHDVQARLFLDGDIFAAKEVDWQLIATIQSVLDKLEKEVLKKHSKK